ncbi:hypothetical protein V495_08475, partial [Pseudogymnoascus sp. VKM F-4514 (FW-929)]
MGPVSHGGSLGGR